MKTIYSYGSIAGAYYTTNHLHDGSFKNCDKLLYAPYLGDRAFNSSVSKEFFSGTLEEGLLWLLGEEGVVNEP